MQSCFAPYPMTIKQMSDWAERMTQLDPAEAVVMLVKLERGRAED
jgi:hypothetical protein